MRDDDRRPALLVSACLLGAPCTHRGDGNLRDEVLALRRRARLVAVCPEEAGGLPTPRPPAEIAADGRVLTEAGVDVTAAYEAGAADAVATALAEEVVGAVLKARSPSCGCRQVRDGTHTGRLRDGEGVTVAALRRVGVLCWSEEDVAAGIDPVDPAAPPRPT